MICPIRNKYHEGIGWIDEYGSYIDCFWSKGVGYFLRDYYIAEIERLCSLSQFTEARTLVTKLDTLNSELAAKQ